MEPAAQRTELLISLLTEHQQALFRYVFSLVGNEADARDILQETSLAISRKFPEYETSRPFLPWAYRFAYFEVLKYREKTSRLPLAVSNDVLELLADERQKIEPELDARLGALTSCLAKLNPEDRRMMTYRYDADHTTDEIMQRMAMTRRTLFRNLERVRGALADCITKQLGQEETV